MIISTTPTIEGSPIRNYLGVVTGETVAGVNVLKDFTAGIRNIIGGRANVYEQELVKARNLALEAMTQRAASMGANAVVGVHLAYQALGSEGGNMFMVSASGTAVQL
ncbi:heavy metal-binding domain-containing protein [Corynebacterium sp. HS2168-gen11]|uniref:heavy metal-binding domain-containing protein n=1 Tax=Corynebacterium sp. HS2168-gen11 TaxID=2974027 RepID=UPI00216B3A20|nr:heavy metal-binding domain-containing protein [Corynebacterium sp. HS2168-gen11]MCS4535528.1 heavy metal-binding domain-containing protein [Corynebacterium sp. HS2168-gen11]